MKKNQRTIQKPAEMEGTGLFGGRKAKLRFVPASPNAGIAFVRTDLPGRPRLPVTPDTVAGKFRRSAVTSEEAEVETIEHLMSALGGLEIDNIDVEIDGSEVPGADGSSLPFVEALRGVGIAEQPEPRKTFAVREPIFVTENEASIVALPGDNGLSISYTLNYPNTALGQQHLTLEVDGDAYAAAIAPARTFCFQNEADAFLQQGLGKGATYQNTVVLGPQGPIENTLRFPNEAVRHKILDLLGDIATLGAGLRAQVVAIKTGHSANIKLVKKIAALFEEGEQAPKRQGGTLMDVREIAKILPHRYPFLLIDKVIEMEGYRRAVGIKNVTFNEPFFQGHFPDQPIMPGVLQIEAMAQLAGTLLMRKSENQKKIAVLLSLDGVKLRKNVVPGDQLRIEVETLKVKARTGEVYTRATVDGALVCEANMKFMLMDGA